MPSDNPQPKRDENTGGLERPLSLSKSIEKLDSDWDKHPRRVYFSELGKCPRKLIWERLGLEMDPEGEGFPAGIGQRGNGVEDRVRHILQDANIGTGSITARGLVLDDVPLSFSPRSIELDSGEELVYSVTGRTDAVIMGENLEILRLTEIKSKGYGLPKDLSSVVEQVGVTRAPLHMVGIDTPEYPEGGVNFDHALQTAMAAALLKYRGNQTPKETELVYVNAGDYEENLEVLFSDSDIETLAGTALSWADWYMKLLVRAEEAGAETLDEDPSHEAHPPPQWGVNYGKKSECKYCDYRLRCEEVCEARGEKRRVQPRASEINVTLKEARED